MISHEMLHPMIVDSRDAIDFNIILYAIHGLIGTWELWHFSALKKTSCKYLSCIVFLSKMALLKLQMTHERSLCPCVAQVHLSAGLQKNATYST